ncbi:MAG: hypothetical protein ABW084_14075, partial [Candidatus Thiodiazotropha sp.]
MRQTRHSISLILKGFFLIFGLWPLCANAWTDDITETAYVNTVCELTPEAQCSWAILIDLEAPGVDSRVRKRRYRRSLPSEPYVRVSPHTAQALIS